MMIGLFPLLMLLILGTGEVLGAIGHGMAHGLFSGLSTVVSFAIGAAFCHWFHRFMEAIKS